MVYLLNVKYCEIMFCTSERGLDETLMKYRMSNNVYEAC